MEPGLPSNLKKYEINHLIVSVDQKSGHGFSTQHFTRVKLGVSQGRGSHLGFGVLFQLTECWQDSFPSGCRMDLHLFLLAVCWGSLSGMSVGMALCVCVCVCVSVCVHARSLQ